MTAAARSSGGGSGSEQKNAATESGHGKTPSTSAASSNDQTEIEPTSTKDPSFSASILKKRIERILQIQQIRSSTVGASNINAKNTCSNIEREAKQEVHIAICAIIVDDFPHEALWKKWIEETGGDFDVDDLHLSRKCNSAATATVEKTNNGVARGEEFDGGRGHKDDCKSDSNKVLKAYAELYVHAKNPERVRSEWLR